MCLGTAYKVRNTGLTSKAVLTNLASTYITNRTSHHFPSYTLAFPYRPRQTYFSLSATMSHAFSTLWLPPLPSPRSHLAVKDQLPVPPSRSLPAGINFLLSWIPIGPWRCLYVGLIAWGLLDCELLASRVRPIHLCLPIADSGCPMQAWGKSKDPLSGLFLKEESLLGMCENANSRLCSFLLLKKTIIRCLISLSLYNRVPKGYGKSLWKK